jgi:mannose-6-phosphate isomerase
MSSIDVLSFVPRFAEKPWGGRRIETALGKSPPAGRRIGESWEISALPGALTPVAAGPLAGRTIPELAADPRFSGDILGPDFRPRDLFPILFKFLDVDGLLSIQVHPPAPPEKKNSAFAKSETWVVIDAAPGAFIWRGFKDGVTENVARQALSERRLQDVIRRFTPRPGDVVDLPAGTVHAAGGGILLAEVQTSADLTCRLYDWDRADAAGVRRELHVDQSFAAVSWKSAGPDTVDGRAETVGGGRRTMLVANHSYELEKWEIGGAVDVRMDGRRFDLLAVVRGEGALEYADGSAALSAGSCFLVPAAMGGYSFRSARPMTVLRSLPVM